MAWTLLLTDLVDSTQRVRELGDQGAAQLFARHDRIARDLLPLHNGREIDKTDGFLMIFEHASDGVAYALAYHQGMRQLSRELGIHVTARAGLHTAPVVLRENSPADVALGAKPLEVDGLAKPTAARIMSLAIGGQTLISQSTRDAAQMPPDTRTVSHGHYRVKGLDQPIQLFEVGTADAPLRPPPDGEKVHRVVQTEFGWAPLTQLPNNLQQPSTRFFGRSSELRQLADRLESHAVVTVLGVGGLGKSRLAQQYARSFMGDYPGGAWWCAVGDRPSVETVCRSVAAALSVPLTQGDPVQRLTGALAGRRRTLLVLDGTLDAQVAAQTVAHWCGDAVRVVAAAHAPMQLANESSLVLGPLPADDGASLFLDRAQAVKPGFVADLDEVQQLVQELDGLPLALELAAGRVRVLTVRKILDRLSRRFDLLKGRDRTTLRGVLDVSWENLEQAERAALSQCTVFAGGWTLDAAEDVLELPDGAWPMDVLEGLALKGLVRTVEHDGEVRFDLLHSIRAYAREHLDGDDLPLRHAAFYAQLEADHVELDNLLAGAHQAADAGDVDLATRCSVRASLLLRRHGPLSTALQLTDLLLKLELSDRQRAQLLGERSRLLSSGDIDAAEASIDEALRVVPDDDELRAELLTTRALIETQRGRARVAEATFQHAMRLVDANSPRVGVVAGNLALLYMRLGQIDAAIRHYEQAIASHRRHANRRSLGVTLGNLGVIHRRLGDHERARELMEQSLALHQELGDKSHEAAVLGSLGLINIQEGDLDAAQARLERAVEVQRSLGNRRGEGIALGNLGSVHLARGELDIARKRMQGAVEVVREAGVPRAEGAFLGTLAEVERLRGDPASARRYLHRAEGLLRRAEDKTELAKVLCRRGHLDLDEGLRQAAEQAQAEARHLVPQVRPDSEIGQLLAALERRLG